MRPALTRNPRGSLRAAASNKRCSSPPSQPIFSSPGRWPRKQPSAGSWIFGSAGPQGGPRRDASRSFEVVAALQQQQVCRAHATTMMCSVTLGSSFQSPCFTATSRLRRSSVTRSSAAPSHVPRELLTASSREPSGNLKLLDACKDPLEDAGLLTPAGYSLSNDPAAEPVRAETGKGPRAGSNGRI